MPGPPASRHFYALDSIRGLASLVVVISHTLNLFPAWGGQGGQHVPLGGTLLVLLSKSPLQLLWHGGAAVIVFFVLSGFVLALPWVRGRPPPYPTFAVRRICRIFLPYAAAVAAAMVLATVLAPLHPPHLSDWFGAIWVTPVTWPVLFDHLLMLGQYNTFDNVVWSLDHEMRLSLLFPILLLSLRFGVAGWVAALVALHVGAGIITVLYGWDGMAGEVAKTLRFGMCFVLGATLARYADRLAVVVLPASRPVAWGLLATGMALLWWSYNGAAMSVGAMLIIAAAILPGRIRTALQRPALVELGRVSYSLYLTHLLVIVSAVYLLHAYLPLAAIALLAFALTLPTAWVFNRWVEVPANRLGLHLVGGRRPATQSLNIGSQLS